MRAVVVDAPGRWSVREVADPVLPPLGLLVEVEAAGVCAADRMLFADDHPWGALAHPFTPGHELLGRVVASDRADVAVGIRVTAEVALPCGTCARCREGLTQLCPGAPHLGSTDVPGALAERLALPARARVHAVPDHVDRDRAVLAEPAACALHAVRRGGVGPGTSVAVVGLGPVGALAVLAARAEGAADVRAVVRDPTSPRASLLREVLGVDVVGRDDAGADERADVVVETAGTATGVDASLAVGRPGGVVVLYGVQRGPVTVDLNLVAELGERDLRGGHLAPTEFPDAVARLADLPDGLVTAVRPLERVHDAVAPVPAEGGVRLKEVLVP